MVVVVIFCMTSCYCYCCYCCCYCYCCYCYCCYCYRCNSYCCCSCYCCYCYCCYRYRCCLKICSCPLWPELVLRLMEIFKQHQATKNNGKTTNNNGKTTKTTNNNKQQRKNNKQQQKNNKQQRKNDKNKPLTVVYAFPSAVVCWFMSSNGSVAAVDDLPAAKRWKIWNATDITVRTGRHYLSKESNQRTTMTITMTIITTPIITITRITNIQQ